MPLPDRDDAWHVDAAHLVYVLAICIASACAYLWMHIALDYPRLPEDATGRSMAVIYFSTAIFIVVLCTAYARIRWRWRRFPLTMMIVPLPYLAFASAMMLYYHRSEF